MTCLLETESTLTDRYQTTIPEAIRLALKLNKRDKIRYRLKDSGEVVLERAQEQEEHDDPVVATFLQFLEQDMMAHPQRLRPLDQNRMDRMRALVGDIEIDLDAPIMEDQDYANQDVAQDK